VAASRRVARSIIFFLHSDKKAKEVLQLQGEGLSYRLIGRNVGLSKNTVMVIITREEAARLSARHHVDTLRGIARSSTRAN
jgi:DNA-directed RNA polymerase specialized sigma24 family protein